MIQFRCPACKEALNVADSHAGTMGKCPKCGRSIHVPTAVPTHKHKKHHKAHADHPAVPGTNGLAVAGMVFAAVAVLLGVVLSVPLVPKLLGSTGPSGSAGLVLICYVLMCVLALLGLVFSILGLRRARSAGWPARLPVAGLILSCVLVAAGATLSSAVLRMQREMVHWVDESYRQLGDPGPNEPGR